MSQASNTSKSQNSKDPPFEYSNVPKMQDPKMALLQGEKFLKSMPKIASLKKGQYSQRVKIPRSGHAFSQAPKSLKSMIKIVNCQKASIPQVSRSEDGKVQICARAQISRSQHANFANNQDRDTDSQNTKYQIGKLCSQTTKPCQASKTSKSPGSNIT